MAVMRLLTLLCLALLIAQPAGAQTKPAASKPAAARPTFDARDPASLTALLAEMDAKGEISGSDADSVFLRVTTPAYGFSVQFAGCDASRKACKAVLFSAPATKGAASLIQLNRFNQTAIACRAFQDQAGQLRAAYDALLFARDGREEMTAHLGAWQGCLAAFGEFLDDPNGYLASAP
jgi:hypothetical protein